MKYAEYVTKEFSKRTILYLQSYHMLYLFKHLLLKCSRFSEIRIALFDHVRKSCPRIDTLNDENKFIYLLNSSGSTIKEVAKFLHSAYTARSA